MAADPGQRRDHRILDDHDTAGRGIPELVVLNTRLLAITNSVQEGLLVVDSSGVALRANRFFYELFPVPPGDVEDRPLSALEPVWQRLFGQPGNLDQIAGDLLADHEGVASTELEQTWPVPRDLTVTSSPVSTHEGEYLGRVLVFRDITAQKQAEREKADFFSAISHELRTPLTSIKGYTEMVLDGDAGDIDDEVRDYLGVVHSNAERLMSLVNDLLDYQRLSSGRVEVKRKPFDLGDVLADLEATMTHLIADKGQRYSVDVHPDAARVLGDRDKTLQVLINYVSNAVKYSPEGADIRLTAATDFPADAAEGTMVARITVTDTGYGISSEDQQRLFTKFFRAEDPHTRTVGGTGLGLNIVKQIVEAQGGQVSVRSTPGSGSQFGFTIPLADGPAS